MTKLPTLLLADAADLADQLSKVFPPVRCRIVTAATREAALKLAAEASLVVVNTSFPEGGELCRQLRNASATGHLPIVLRVAKGAKVHALATVWVEARDAAALARAIRQLCPALEPPAALPPAAPPPAAPPAASSAGSSRRVAPAPAPPLLAEGQDLLEHGKLYTSYLQQRCSALEARDNPSAEERQTLTEEANRAATEAEALLSALQTGVMGALASKDLERMKALSAVKTAVYEGQRRLKAALALDEQLLGEGAAPISAADRQPRRAPTVSALAQVESGPAPTGTPAEAVTTVPVAGQASKKSALTLAAEAKAARTREAGAVQLPASQMAKRSQPARDRLGLVLMVVAVASALVGGALYFRASSDRSASAVTADGNHPPVVRAVTLAQTPSGIQATVRAEDEDRDVLTHRFTWSVNGQIVPNESTARLGPRHYAAEDTIMLEVIASDGKSASSPLSSQPLVVASLGKPAFEPAEPELAEPEPAEPEPVPAEPAPAEPAPPSAPAPAEPPE